MVSIWNRAKKPDLNESDDWWGRAKKLFFRLVLVRMEKANPYDFWRIRIWKSFTGRIPRERLEALLLQCFWAKETRVFRIVLHVSADVPDFFLNRVVSRRGDMSQC